MVTRNEIFEVYAAPMSGGGFPAQLQEILYYTDQRQKAFSDQTENISSYYLPDLCMGTSGGNVALYLAISGNFNEGNIHRVVETLTPKMFSQNWWPGPMSFIPTWLLGVFEGSVYKPGYGAGALMKAFNTTSSIQTIEMWNSSFNKEQNRTALFCNKKSSDTYISPFTYSSFDFKTLPLKFNDGDIQKISQTIIASASIPLLFQPVVIDGENYIDGGVTYPSPLTPLQEEIYKCVTGGIEPLSYETVMSSFPIPAPTPEQKEALEQKRDKNILHLTYFSPYNIDDTSDDVESALGGNNVFSDITDGSAVKDRYTGINLLLRLKTSSQNVNVIDSRTRINPSVDDLSVLLKEHKDTHYFCQIYVRKNEWIDMTNFTPQDIFDKMEYAKSQIEYLFFYVSD